MSHGLMDQVRNNQRGETQNAMQPSEQLVNQLLTEAREGSQSAIGELMASYGGYLRSVARHQLGSKLCGRVSPSDLVQETLFAAWKDFASFQGTAPQFSAWLRTILVRKVSSAVALHMSTSKRDISRESSATVDNMVVEVNEALHSREKMPSEAVSIEEDAVIIQRLLANLPEEYRKVIQWRIVDNTQFKEIAKRIGKSSGATRLVWLRAMRMLREMYVGSDGQ